MEIRVIWNASDRANPRIKYRNHYFGVPIGRASCKCDLIPSSTRIQECIPSSVCRPKKVIRNYRFFDGRIKHRGSTFHYFPFNKFIEEVKEFKA